MAQLQARPRVLFMTAAYPTADATTSGTFVREHARAAQRVAEVALVHLNRVDGFPLPRSVPVSGEPFPAWRVDYPRRPLPLSYAGDLAAAFSGLRAVRNSGFHPDLIHANFFLAAAPAVLLGALLRIPVVTTEHWSVFLPSDPAQLGPLTQRVARSAFERSAIVLPVSEALRDAIRESGISARFRVVPNAVDGSVFHESAAPARGGGRPWRLLTVSGLYEAKGYEFLLPAIAQLVEAGLELKLDVVGGGDRRVEYERLAGELGLEKVVVFHGEKTKPEVAAFMRDADFFVLASRYENNPCAVLEAQTSGLPVVATRVGGVPEIVTPSLGLLAEPCDVDDLARRIREAIDGIEGYDRAAIAEHARERYGLDAVGSSLAGVYRDALAER